LCLTRDNRSQGIEPIWDRISKLPIYSAIRNRSSFGAPELFNPIGQLDAYTNPDVLAKDENEDRAQLIREAISAQYEEYVLYGHTHREHVSEETANSGSFTQSDAFHITVDGEDVRLNQIQT